MAFSFPWSRGLEKFVRVSHSFVVFLWDSRKLDDGIEKKLHSVAGIVIEGGQSGLAQLRPRSTVVSPEDEMVEE
jgi:hypothetical protein